MVFSSYERDIIPLIVMLNKPYLIISSLSYIESYTRLYTTIYSHMTIYIKLLRKSIADYYDTNHHLHQRHNRHHTIVLMIFKRETHAIGLHYLVSVALYRDISLAISQAFLSPYLVIYLVPYQRLYIMMYMSVCESVQDVRLYLIPF